MSQLNLQQEFNKNMVYFFITEILAFTTCENPKTFKDGWLQISKYYEKTY
jgi:hypothetical protein